MLHTKFRENRPAVQEKKIFEWFLPYNYGCVGHLGHVCWSPKCYIPSFLKLGLPVLEKKIFEWFLPYMGIAAILVM